eukprot:COSAG02_NODE_36365_length_455_cov_1.160112_2_plen_21_part_01
MVVLVQQRQSSVHGFRNDDYQ